MQFYDISFMYPHKQSGRWQDVLDTAIDQTAYMDAWKKYHKTSWGWTLECSKHVEDTIINLLEPTGYVMHQQV